MHSGCILMGKYVLFYCFIVFEYRTHLVLNNFCWKIAHQAHLPNYAPETTPQMNASPSIGASPLFCLPAQAFMMGLGLRISCTLRIMGNVTRFIASKALHARISLSVCEPPNYH